MRVTTTKYTILNNKKKKLKASTAFKYFLLQFFVHVCKNSLRLSNNRKVRVVVVILKNIMRRSMLFRCILL